MVRGKPYRLVAAYDSETTTVRSGGRLAAFPCTHQLLVLGDGVDLASLTADNLDQSSQLHIYRHAADLFAALDELARPRDFVPVVAVHNLGFDMWGLSPWIDERAQALGVDVLAKSTVKPITFTIKGEDGRPALVLWDTLQFSMQSLERMGKDCKAPKAVGAWDYDKLRAPDTPLSDDEAHYAAQDVRTLMLWLAWWLRRNRWASWEDLGRRIVTKTGIVRAKIADRLDSLRLDGGATVGDLFFKNSVGQAPKDDAHLHTMHAATRGGLTFCASKWASVPISGATVASFDAVSQHPAQMTSHRYPHDFRPWDPKILLSAFKTCATTSPRTLLERWERPFASAFYGCFIFEGLRLRAGSIFEREGMASLADARLGTWADVGEDGISHEGQRTYKISAEQMGYRDRAEGVTCLLGKIIAADRAILWLTELEAYVMGRVYEWDGVEALEGFGTWRYQRPTDRDLLAVASFYAAKRDYKLFMEDHHAITPERACEIMPPDFYAEIMAGRASEADIKAYYQILKSDLNALFGVAATNEARPDARITRDGIRWGASAGVADLPRRPKAWYQYGQRIVGWSRVAQIVALETIGHHAAGIVNGDTDSVKAICDAQALARIERDLQAFHRHMLRARSHVMERAERYGIDCDLGDMGLYECEYTTSNFCAAWNKAYVKRSDDGAYSFTLAGLPSARRSDPDLADSLNDAAAALEAEGCDFGAVCDELLSYNLTISPSVGKLKGRLKPAWAGTFYGRVTDHLGAEHHVMEPAAMALYPMPKILGGTGKDKNADNLKNAASNRPSVAHEPRTLHHDGARFQILRIDWEE